MKSTKSFTFEVALIISILWLSSCTSNPFGDSEISAPGRTISGKVRLSSNENPEDVFIWFEGFNFDTRPDPQGNFQVTLPPPSAQSSNGGVTGVFNLYFYIANFALVIKPVVFLDGVISNNESEMNEKGEFLHEILLSELLKIRTEIQPEKIEKGSESVSITANVILQTFKDTVDVFFPTRVANLIAPIFLQNQVTGEVSILQTTVPDKKAKDSLRVSTTAEIRELKIELNLSEFPPAKYEVIPYFMVINPLVPEGLFASIGTNVQDFGLEYLKIPFKRSGGQFEIVEQVGMQTNNMNDPLKSIYFFDRINKIDWIK